MTRHTRRRERAQERERVELYDDQQQENLISKFEHQVAAQRRVITLAMSIIGFLPTPAFIFQKQYRQQPKLSFLSLCCLFFTQYLLRRTYVVKYRLANLAFGAILAVAGLLSHCTLFCFPFIFQASEFVIEYWINQSEVEIRNLTAKKYDLRGV